MRPPAPLVPALSLAVALCALVALERSGGTSEDAAWQAGAASVDITPEMPMWLSGYGSRDRPGDEVAAPIHAKALALRDASGRTAVFVTLDLLGVHRALRESVVARVAERHGLDPNYLLFNASHTHSGPELRIVDTSLGRVDEERRDRVERYQAFLEDRIVQAVDEALADLAPAQVAFSKARAGFAMNRRADYSLPPDHPRAGKRPNPAGPVDHEVPVLSVSGGDGGLRAVLFGYACHATTTGDYRLHGDYPGFAQAHLEEAHPGAVALFLTGCGGDQNPHPRRDMVPGLEGLELARQHGRTLALAVEAALHAHPVPLRPSLESVLEDVDLAYLPPPSREELQERLESSRSVEREHAQVLLEHLEREGGLPTHYPYPVQVMRVGDELTLVGLASEVVVDYSLRLKAELPDPEVWVAAYCNDFMGYLPSRRIWEEGGYEGGDSMTFSSATLYRTYHPNIWDPSVEERIVVKVHELRARLGREE